MSSMLCVICPEGVFSPRAFVPRVSCAVRNLWASGQVETADSSSGGSLGAQRRPPTALGRRRVRRPLPRRLAGKD
eukprot:8041425-Pyramimonas_sp.AAC.1